MDKGKEKSVIAIIQQMVKQGAEEEEIVKSLIELGVEKEQAKRLLLLGQANTFALLQGEIKKMIAEEIENQTPLIQKTIEEKSIKASAEIENKIKETSQKELQAMENEIKRKSANFQKEIDEKVKASTEITTKTKDKLNELGEAVGKVGMDLNELKLSGIGKRNQWISIILVVLGIAFFAFDAYLFLTQFSGTLSTDSLIITIVFAMIGISLMFVATLI
ncbi:MAG: hypothetical protein ABIA76_01140 [Candidatus Diapherotrites archaeon]